MPEYFPENNTPQWGDTAERSLQKISDLLKNGDVPIRINSVAVTGPFTVNNEVEITNDEGEPIPVAGIESVSGDAFGLQLTPDKRLKVDSGPVPEIIGTYTVLGSSTASEPISISGYPPGTVLMFVGPWSGGGNLSWRLERGQIAGGQFSSIELQDVFNAFTQQKISQFSSSAQVFLYRVGIGAADRLRLAKASGGGSNVTFRVYVYDQLDFGDGYPHVNSNSSLVYSLDNNLKVSDLQTQTRLGDVTDVAPTIDTPTDKGLLPMFKRLLVRITDLLNILPASRGSKNSAGSFPVVLASDQATLGVSGTVGVSNAFATEATASALNNKVPSGLFVNNENRLVVSEPSVADRLGSTDQASASSDTGTFGLNALIKRLLTHVNPYVEITEAPGTAPAQSTEVLPQNTGRRYLFLQNLSTAPIYISFGGTASTSTLRLDAGASLSFEARVTATNSIRMRGSTTGQNYYLAHG